MNSNKSNVVYSLFIVIFLVACSPQVGYKALSFLFDGVPEPSPSDSMLTIDSVIQVNSNINIEKKSKPQMLYHIPYSEKQCLSCHDKNSIGKLLKSEPELCYMCHEDLNNKYKHIHGPIAGGGCSICHNPHQSNFSNLLVYKDQKMCVQCHDSLRLSGTKFHLSITENSCTECHNAHGGDNRYFNKQGACYYCHENFNEKYSYLHGPAGGEYCSTCHKGHGEGDEVLLIEFGQPLCFICHNSDRILQIEVHVDIEDADCIMCHNPHGGEDKYLLN
ncbi:cytochrome c3 family protein [Bacteroidota bacterium]